MSKGLIKLLVLLFVSLGLSFQLAYADTESFPTSGRVAYIMCCNIPDDLENPVDVMVGNKIKKIPLAKRSIRGSVRIPADGIIKVVRQIPNPHSVTPLYMTLAQAFVPQGVHKALIILAPADPDKSDFLFNAKVQDLGVFTGGDYLFINISPARIAVKMGDEKLGIKPMGSKIYDAGHIKEATNVVISYHWFHPGKKDWKRISASTVVSRPGRREICVFSWDSKKKRIDYHGLTFPVDK